MNDLRAELIAIAGLITAVYAIVAPGKPAPPIVADINKTVQWSDAETAKRKAQIDRLDQEFEAMLRLNAKLSAMAKDMQK